MQDISKPLRSKSYSVPCELCSIGSICIPMALNNTLESVLNRKRSFAKNEILVTEGDEFQRFYIIHSGALKTYVIINGTEQINGFYLPGDIIGLDSITTHKYNNTIKALTTTLACELKYDELMALVTKSTQVRDTIFNLMSQNILNYQKMILAYSQKNAEEKLAAFICWLYTQYAKRGHTSLSIKLSMCRADIANYLGLTIETVSRILTRTQELGILSVRGKYICIKDLSALFQLAAEKI
ncbi:CRP/FNR family transcriptional regulator [Orbus hercynius]|uniref:CRP/FNR family transcriptional regulator n=1 Tax=Orbus hercynius TaxID=593135 RepID=A0A495RK28_9GAMM|nr:fumarate/nitrate reduction transcriptional regulator Fnr [Orbus hercynius]RKS87516.1 CRP/FNR family transcriptional regulator [Orbus hercynius]